MEKRHIISSLLVFAFIAVSMQGKAQSLNYGLQVGINQTNFRSDFFYHPQLVQGDLSSKFTFGVNAIIEYKPNKIGIALEPGYIVKALSSSSLNVQERDLDARLHFIQLPIMLVVDPSQNLSFFVGPEIAYNINTAMDPEEYEDVFINQFEFSIGFGGLVRFKEKYAVGIKYNLGLNSLTEKELGIAQSIVSSTVDLIDTRTKSSYLQLFFRYYLK